MPDNTTKSSLYWNTLIRIPNQIVCFIISIIVARALTPNDFGIMAIAMMLIGYANLFSNVGLCEAIIQKNITDKNLINSIFTVDLSISLFLATSFFFLANFISVSFDSPECAVVIKVVCVVFIITSFEAMSHALLRRDMKFKVVAIVETGKSFFMAILTLILALLDFDYWALVFGQIIPLTLFTIILCMKAGWWPKIKYNHSQMCHVYNFGLWNFLKSQTIFLSSHVDKIIIGKFLGTGALGLYDKAMSISFIPLTSFTMNINSVMFSSFSRCKEDLTVLRDQFKKSVGIISVFNFPLYTGLIIIAPYFVNVLLGEKWSPMIDPFKVILVGCILKSLGGVAANLNISIGQFKKNSQYLIIATLLLAVSAFYLKSYGILGVSVAFLFFCIIEIFMLLSLSIVYLKMRVVDLVYSLLPAMLGSGVMYFVCYLVEKISMTSYTIVNMTILIFVGAVTYLLFCMTTKFEIFLLLKEAFINDVFDKFLRRKI